MQMGLRLVQEAYRQKVTTLETEIRSLKISNDEFRQAFAALQKKSVGAERELSETQVRNAQLQEELKSLMANNRMLSRQLEKQRQLQASIAETLSMSRTEEDGDDYSRNGMPMRLSHAQVNSFSQGAASHPQASSLSFPSPSVDGSSSTQGVDGKAFFRAARGRLSYESFNNFLGAIKRLNAHQVSKEEVIEEARGIFGPDGRDLLDDFLLLINRHN